MKHDKQFPDGNTKSSISYYKPGALTKKNVIELHYMYGLNVFEISYILGCSYTDIQYLMNKERLPERHDFIRTPEIMRWLPGINIPREFLLVMNDDQEVEIHFPERGIQKRARLMVEAVVECNDIEELQVVHRNGLNFDDRYANLYLIHPTILKSLNGDLSKIDDLPEYCFISFHKFDGMESYLRFSNEILYMDKQMFIPREDICLVLDSPNKYFNY
ncbi:MAG: hypothetical protein JRI80_20045 [Deltaproteobacteria bacterium]|nr:hypothetical protein [Deltaproteobacteria bacterium]